MKTNTIELLKNRRSIYHLGKNVSLENNEITNLIKEAVKESPSSFNSQTSRVVVLFNNQHLKLWEIVEENLRKVVPTEEAFQATQEKINSFRAGYGTILFYEDEEVVRGLQENFSLYADNFPIWSEQSSGIASVNVWTALAENEIGASLQHYNPLIDSDVANEWNLPSTWKLRAQMPFGSIETPAEGKAYMDDEERFRIFE